MDGGWDCARLARRSACACSGGGGCCGRSDSERPWRHAVARPAPLHRAESRRRRPGFRLSGRIHLSERRNRTSAASSDPQTLIQVGRPCRDGRVASANLDTGRDSDPGHVTSGSRPHGPASQRPGRLGPGRPPPPRRYLRRPEAAGAPAAGAGLRKRRVGLGPRATPRPSSVRRCPAPVPAAPLPGRF